MELDFDIPDPATGPFAVDNGGCASAVLFLHGVTGSPAAWKPIARAVAAAGVTVSVPLLPGHGTSWRDLGTTSWTDWRASAAAEYHRLRARHPSVLVAGLSMGGALALDLAIAAAEAGEAPMGLVLVNPALHIDSPLAPALPLLRHVVPSIAAIGNDIAAPGRDEHAYDRTPIAAIASFSAALPHLRDRLHLVTPPVSLLLSGGDGVVGPRSQRTLRSNLPQAPDVVALRRSRHVATLDYDAPLIADVVMSRLGTPAPTGTIGNTRR